MKQITDKNEMIDFLKSHPIGVLSTVSTKNKPQGSVIYYLNEGLDIYFITRNETQKHKALEQNDAVSFLVYDTTSRHVLHIDGTCNTVDDGHAFTDVINRIADVESKINGPSLPPVAQLDEGEYELYRIKAKETHFVSYDT